MMSVQVGDFVDLSREIARARLRSRPELASSSRNFSTAAMWASASFIRPTPHIRSAWQSVGFEDEGPGSESVLVWDMTGIRRNSGSCPTRLSWREIPLVAFLGASLLAGPEWRLAVALAWSQGYSRYILPAQVPGRSGSMP